MVARALIAKKISRPTQSSASIADRIFAHTNRGADAGRKTIRAATFPVLSILMTARNIRVPPAVGAARPARHIPAAQPLAVGR